MRVLHGSLIVFLLWFSFGYFSLSKNPGVDKGPQPLMFNPALTTQGELPRRGKRRSPGGCASERMKTQRFSYFAGFAARRPAAAGQFRPVSRGGTSCFLQGKTRKTQKVAFSHFFNTLTFLFFKRKVTKRYGVKRRSPSAPSPSCTPRSGVRPAGRWPALPHPWR